MKKSLIALAALAAFGTASAQSTVTVSGKLRYAFVSNSSTTTSTAVKAAGIQITDGDFVLTSVEDLGGGLKATASMAVQTGGRSRTIGSRDGSLSLSGGFGTVGFSSVDAGNGIYSLGSAGASYLLGLDSLVILDSGNTDLLTYTSPTVSGFTGKVSIIDSATAVDYSTSSTTGLSQNSTTAAQDGMVYGVTYVNGPLSVAADITTYGNNGIAAATARANGRTRVSASYNLGVAVIGAGYETRDAATSSTATELTTKETIIGINVPVGAFDFGVNYATSKTDGDTYSKKGFDLGARYNFSKRTYAAVRYQSVDNVNLAGVAAATNEAKITQFQISHAF